MSPGEIKIELWYTGVSVILSIFANAREKHRRLNRSRARRYHLLQRHMSVCLLTYFSDAPTTQIIL